MSESWKGIPEEITELKKLLTAKKAEGFLVIGKEKTTEDKFVETNIPGEKLFQSVPVTTIEEIISKYKELFLAENSRFQDVELELVLDTDTEEIKKLKQISDSEEEYKKLIDGLPEGKRNYIILARGINKE